MGHYIKKPNYEIFLYSLTLNLKSLLFENFLLIVRERNAGMGDKDSSALTAKSLHA